MQLGVKMHRECSGKSSTKLTTAAICGGAADQWRGRGPVNGPVACTLLLHHMHETTISSTIHIHTTTISSHICDDYCITCTRQLIITCARRLSHHMHAMAILSHARDGYLITYARNDYLITIEMHATAISSHAHDLMTCA